MKHEPLSCKVSGGSQSQPVVPRLREHCVAILTRVSVSFVIRFRPAQNLVRYSVSQGLGQCDFELNFKPFLMQCEYQTQKQHFICI